MESEVVLCHSHKTAETDGYAHDFCAGGDFRYESAPALEK